MRYGRSPEAVPQLLYQAAATPTIYELRGPAAAAVPAVPKLHIRGANFGDNESGVAAHTCQHAVAPASSSQTVVRSLQYIV